MAFQPRSAASFANSRRSGVGRGPFVRRFGYDPAQSFAGGRVKNFGRARSQSSRQVFKPCEDNIRRSFRRLYAPGCRVSFDRVFSRFRRSIARTGLQSRRFEPRFDAASRPFTLSFNLLMQGAPAGARAVARNANGPAAHISQKSCRLFGQ
jgi:hypothetical protein